MFEAYSIGVTLKLNNLISPQLTLLSKEFEKLDGLTIALRESLGKISVESASLRGLASATAATNRAFESAAVSAAAFHRQLSAIRATGALPGGGGSPGGGGGRGHGSSGFHGGNIHLGPGGVGLGTVGMGAGDWFWPVAAGGAAVYAGSSLFQSAKDLDTERQRFRLFGMTEAQNQDAFRYVQGMNIYGSSQIGNMAAFREAQGVGRESGLGGADALRFAKLSAPVLSQLDALGASLDDESMGKLHSSNVALLRFVEQSGGLKDADTFKRLANVAYKLRQSSGDTIDFEQLRQVTARGGAYTQNMTDEGRAHAEPIIQELKGSAYGVGVSTAGNRLFGALSRTPKNLIAEMTRLGLWTDKRHSLSPEDQKAYMADFVGFYIDRVMPAYAKAGINGGDRVRENAILFQTTGARVANLIDKQLPSIEKSFGAYKSAKGIDDATKQLSQSLAGEQREFESAWKDFKTEWGTTMLPAFTGILKAGAEILRTLPHPTSEGLAKAAATALAPNASLIGDVWSLLLGTNRTAANEKAARTAAPMVQVNHQTVLDGKVLANSVTQYQSIMFQQPETSASGFDSRMHLLPPGLSR